MNKMDFALITYNGLCANQLKPNPTEYKTCSLSMAILALISPDETKFQYCEIISSNLTQSKVKPNLHQAKQHQAVKKMKGNFYLSKVQTISRDAIKVFFNKSNILVEFKIKSQQIGICLA